MTTRHAMVLALAAALLVSAFCVLFVRQGGAFLARRDFVVGEVMLVEAERFVAAGQTGKAIERYRMALAGRFAADKNLRRAEGGLGRLLKAEGRGDEALSHLEAAVGGKTPDGSAFFDLVTITLAEESPKTGDFLARWQDWLDKRASATTCVDDDEERARLHWVRGLYLLSNDGEGASREFGQAVKLDPACPAALELARMTDEKEAVTLRAEFVAHGGIL